MIQVQFVLDFQSGKNLIELNILEREDANDLERQMAGHIQELHLGIFAMIEEQLPGVVGTTVISKEP